MALASFTNWQQDLLPHIVDRRAQEQPNVPYGLWPVAQASYKAGFRTIDYGQLSNIVNGLAWWIMTHIGVSENEQQVLTYVGPNDVRLTAMILASVKTGYVLFLTSPRNSPDAHQSLFTELKCRTLVTTEPRLPPVVHIVETVNPRCLAIPSIEELLSTHHPSFHYVKTTEEARRDPAFIIHTSGSTGIPKPLIWNQESVARHRACSGLSYSLQPGFISVDNLLWGKRVMVTVPPFHGAGVGMYLFWGIPFRSVPIAPAAVGIVTAQGLADALEKTPADIAILVPSVVAELAQDALLLARCARYLDLILYIGGDLPQAIGDCVVASIPLRCWWGASECGMPCQLVPPSLGPYDWRYIQFHPSVGAIFDQVTEDTYELVIRRNDDLPQVCFSILGQELEEYRTKDLFQCHPTIPNTWCWRARTDDIIVFLNGEKTNPVSMEQHVAQHPEVAGALVIGTQRFQAALLIEMAISSEGNSALTTAEQAQLIERIWPTIQEANRLAPAHARIEKALVLLLPADRPLLRAAKGTIQRAANIAQYATEVDALYANANVADSDDDNDQGLTAPSINMADAVSVNRFITESVGSVTGWFDSALFVKVNQDRNHNHNNETFFDHGMDSLMALELLRILRRGLHRPDLGLSTIYSNPTIPQLQAAVMSNAGNAVVKDDDALLMEPLLRAYDELIQKIPTTMALRPGHEPDDGPVTVILTGSTGTIGTFLLFALLGRPQIKHVICLNRGRDGGRAAQRARLAAAGLEIGDLDQRVTFLQADLSQPLLGLDKARYEELRTRVDIQLIMHNAWPVNFNLGLALFKPQFAGLINLFRLASEMASNHMARMVFISSVSAVGGLAAEGKPVPERIFTPLNTPYANGYARSKFISELLCDSAARKLGIPTMVFRVGQVAGAICHSGEWNRSEWLPSLVIGSRDLGCLPDNIGPFSDIDWIPSDALADVLVDLATCQSESELSLGVTSHEQCGAQVYNLRNPCFNTWKSLLPTIVEAFSEANACSDQAPVVVGPSAWLTRLSNIEGNTNDDGPSPSNTAIRLYEFYRDHLWATGSDSSLQNSQTMAIEHSLTKSPTLYRMQAIDTNSMRKWVGEWLAPDDRSRSS